MEQPCFALFLDFQKKPYNNQQGEKKMIKIIKSIFFYIVLACAMTLVPIFSKTIQAYADENKEIILEDETEENYPIAQKKGLVLYKKPKIMYCKDLNYRTYQTDTFSDASLKKSYTTHYSLVTGQLIKVLGHVKGSNIYYIEYNHLDYDLHYWHPYRAFCRKSILEKKRSPKSIKTYNYFIQKRKGICEYNFPKNLDTQIEISQHGECFGSYTTKINENTYKAINLFAPVTATMKILKMDEEKEIAKLRIKINGKIEDLDATNWANWYGNGKHATPIDQKYFKFTKNVKKQTVEITLKGSGTWFVHLTHKINEDGSIGGGEVLPIGVRIP